MANNVRFYLDENVDNDVAAGLRHHKIDVVTTHEAGNLGIEDEAQLAFAASRGRVIVTQDSDFLVFHSKGIQHAGICYYKAQTRTVKQILRALYRIYEQLDAAQMVNNVEYL